MLGPQGIFPQLNAAAGPSRLLALRLGEVTALTGPSSRWQVTRCLHQTRRTRASVSGPAPDDVLRASEPMHKRTPAQAARNGNAAPNSRQSAIDAARERKLKEYEALLKQKAAERGLDSVEELRLKAQEERKAREAEAAQNASAGRTAIEERDAKVVEGIRARAEAEAKRKLESGELTRGGSSGSPVKPLGEILDLQKLMQEPPDRIHQLWTGYHSLKNKLSAVIPASVYQKLISTAKQYPQFVLPLPRAISVSEDGNEAVPADAANAEQKQGYEMHFLQWGFLPPPAAPVSGETAKTLPPPSTVLFTPLAEYKLRQEFAQPLLILTHYTDLAESKGLVLMRGEITGAEEAQAAPTGIAAAAAAKQAGASEEEQQRLAQPLQSQGGMTQQDAQLLSMCLQRFYLPNRGNPAAGIKGDAGAEERDELLKVFHHEPEKFDVAKLVDAAFKFGA